MNRYSTLPIPVFFLLMSLFMAISLCGHSQSLTVKQSAAVFAQVDSMMNAFSLYGGLVKQGEEEITDEGLAIYKSLFEPNARVDDDLVLAYFDGNNVDHHQFTERSIDEYCRKVQSTFHDGLVVEIKRANVYYGNLESDRTARIMVEKFTKATSVGGLLVHVTDTVELTLAFNKNFMLPKITQIKVRTDGYNVLPGYIHMNDVDRDFVPDAKDPCKNKPGYEDRSVQPGCPSINERVKVAEPNMVFDVSASVGSMSFTPSFSSNPFAGYDLASNHTATNKELNTKVSSSLFAINLGYSYFFGRAAKFGVGTGIQYRILSGTAEADDFQVTYKATDVFGNSFRRIIRSDGPIKETFKVNQLAIPLMLKWKGNVSLRLQYEIAAGVIYALDYSGASAFGDNLMNYEGIYTPVKQANGRYVYEYSTVDDVNQIAYTEASVEQTSPGNAEFVLQSVSNEGNDLGLNVKPDQAASKGDFSFNAGLQWALAPSLFFKLNDKLSVSGGALVCLGEITNTISADGYFLTRKSGEYNTVMNGISSAKTSIIALNIGLRYSLIKD